MNSIFKIYGYSASLVGGTGIMAVSKLAGYNFNSLHKTRALLWIQIQKAIMNSV